MDEYLKEFKKKHNKNIIDNKRGLNIKPIITKFLLAIIFFLISIIYINGSDNNLLNYQKYVFTESLPFTKFKSWYEDLFGEILPNSNNTTPVFSDKLMYKKIEDYKDGEVLNLSDKSMIKAFTSGIVVFIGAKEGYGNTVIVQGVDGADIWYGNITNTGVKLYDYIEKDTVIGETIDNKLYLVIKKDDKYIKYEEYKN